MLKKTLLFLYLCSFMLPALAQTQLNPYKYIIIPKNYDFLKKENQYRVNSTTKHLFDQNGYRTLIKGEKYPDEVIKNPCLAATADVISTSNTFTTKLELVLINCQDIVIFRSVIGKSKLKDYYKTYNDALKACFVSIEALDYSFDPNLVINADIAKNSTETVPVAQKTAVEEVVADTAVVTSSQESPEATNTLSAPVAVAAVPIIVKEESIESKEETLSNEVIAQSYKNDNISFFLIEQNGKLVAYVSESKNKNYKKGEMIGTFEKTSLPNVFRVSWKKKDKDIDETTAYFDDSGNLKIDIHRSGKIEVITFLQEK